MWPLFVGVLVCGVIFGGGYAVTWIQDNRDRDDRIRKQDRNDPSLDFDEPWQPSGTYIVENGRAYDQAAIALPPGTEVILPEDREGTSFTVQTDGSAGTVLVLIEKRLCDFGHYGKTRRLRDFRAERRLWKRQVGATLVLDPDGGGFHKHGGSEVRVLVRVPPGTLVRRESIATAHFAGRYDGQYRASDDAARAAGWEEISQQPLPKSEWPLPVERR